MPSSLAAGQIQNGLTFSYQLSTELVLDYRPLNDWSVM